MPQMKVPDALVVPPGTPFRDAPERIQKEFGPYFDNKRLHMSNMSGAYNFCRPDVHQSRFRPVTHPTDPKGEPFVWFVVEKTPEGWVPVGTVPTAEDHGGRFLIGYLKPDPSTDEAIDAEVLARADSIRAEHEAAMKDPQFIELLRTSGALVDDESGEAEEQVVRVAAPRSLKIPEGFRADELA